MGIFYEFLMVSYLYLRLIFLKMNKMQPCATQLNFLKKNTVKIKFIIWTIFSFQTRLLETSKNQKL